MKGTFTCSRCKTRYNEEPHYDSDVRYTRCPSCGHEDDIQIWMYGITILLPTGEPARFANIEAEYFKEEKAVYVFYTNNKIVANVSRAVAHEILKLNTRFN